MTNALPLYDLGECHLMKTKMKVLIAHRLFSNDTAMTKS